jgi:hypothetical protein
MFAFARGRILYLQGQDELMSIINGFANDSNRNCIKAFGVERKYAPILHGDP